MATETNAFLTWFSSWGSVIYAVVQMVFWIVVAAAALIIALQYKRFVAYKAGKPAAGDKVPEVPAATATTSSPSVSVEEFVD